MDSEQTSLELRAARHAALGDAVRLRIVDLLALGDLPVGEIRADLGIPANLLSHHLTVLRAVGILGERRSQGDGRRKYLTLLQSQIPQPSTLPIRARRVLFVCTGNSARSPLAALLWQRVSPIPATSAGTRPAPAVADIGRQVAARHGLDLGGHHPRKMTETIQDGDVVVSLCDRAHESMGSANPVHWSIPNPTPIGTVEAYETALAEIERRVRNLAPHVVAA